MRRLRPHLRAGDASGGQAMLLLICANASIENAAMQAARHLLGVLTLGFALQCWAVLPGSKVPDFKLTDHRGQAHRLYDLTGEKAIVIMIQGNGCPIVRQAL